MITANKNLRAYMKQNKVPYWELANALGIAETTLIRWLRTELPAEKTKEFKLIVEQIVEGRRK